MAEEREHKKDEEEPGLRMPGVQVIGATLVLLVLAAYFLWMTLEMSKAAVSGAAPMFAFLGAALVGCLAAGVALAIGRKQR